MKSRYEVLSAAEVEQIHQASMEVLAETGLKVEYGKARELLREAGCRVDDEKKIVRIPEELIHWAVEQTPEEFDLYGADKRFKTTIGGEQITFAGLGTPTSILDTKTGAYRPTNMEDLVRHIKLIDACKHIHCTQMDVWPNDIPMTTIHVEAIKTWTKHSRKPFGLGCYGYIPTLDMMRMMALAAGMAIWAMGQALALAHYINPTAADPLPFQPVEVINTIRLFMGPIPAALLIIAIVFAWRYPITREHHQDLCAQIAAGDKQTETGKN